MDNAAFDALSDDEKIRCLLGYASAIFGESTVRSLYDRFAPIVRDCAGNGQDYDDPTRNWWGGHWQIYRAD